MLVIGHRGAAGRVAENTLAAMRFAVDAGADGVEFDVREHHGSLILLHDATLERTTNGRGRWDRMAPAELRRLTTANGEPIAELDAALAVVAGCAIVNVEIKQPGIAAAVIDALDDFINTHDLTEAQCLLSSFDAQTTAELAARRGHKRLGYLYEGNFEFALQRAIGLRANTIHPPLKDVEAERIERAHAHGLEVYVYTVNDPHDIDLCQRCGVDAIFSDYPDRALEHLRGSGVRR